MPLFVIHRPFIITAVAMQLQHVQATCPAFMRRTYYERAQSSDFGFMHNSLLLSVQAGIIIG